MSGEGDRRNCNPAVDEEGSPGDAEVARSRVTNAVGRRSGRHRVVALGLTGGIGAGKSTALAEFAAAGALTLSADRIVHDLYEDPAFSAQVIARFGPQVSQCGTRLDRSRLAAAVRGNVEHLRWLEELTHPVVAAEIEQFIVAAPDGSVVVCEVPLLFEAGLEGIFDQVITIEASESERRLRSSHRTRPEAFAEFDRLQASTERRSAGSDLVFHNNEDVPALRAFVRGAYENALALLRDSSS